jgi:hypothetical protein
MVNFSCNTHTHNTLQVSKDGTVKRAYALHDGQMIESVLMPYQVYLFVHVYTLYLCTCIHVCIHVCVCVCVCARARAWQMIESVRMPYQVYLCLHTTHTCGYKNMFVCIHVCIHRCGCVGVSICERVCVCLYLCLSVRKR